MRILVIGSGGREHALCWKLRQSPKVSDLYCAPGNGGTAFHAENVELNITDHKKVIAFCKKRGVDLVVVGPEAPLAVGIADDITRFRPRIRGRAPGIQQDIRQRDDGRLQYPYRRVQGL